MTNTATIFPTGASELPEQLKAVVRRVGEQEAADSLRQVFSFLTDLMTNLPEGESLTGCTQEEVLVSLASTREDAYSLADHIDWVTERAETEGQPLTEALAGVSFALRHEAGRITDLKKGAGPESGADLWHAVGLLRNCFQQCIVMLARAVDPALEANDLFDEDGRRLRESVALRDALSRLIESLKQEGGQRYPQSAVSVIEQVEAFRCEGMPYLMRRDWPAFDAFADDLTSAREQKKFDAAAKSFLTYLETLLGHVQMRAVLNDPHAVRERASWTHVWAPLRRAAGAPMMWSAAMTGVVVACCVFLTHASGTGKAVGAKSAGAPPPVIELPTPGAEKAAAEAIVETSVAASSAVATPSEGGRPWTLQIGAYGDQAKAAGVVAHLKSSEVEARVVEAKADGQGTVYRVRAGRYDSLQAASAAGRELRARGAIRDFVTVQSE